jgi:hypothetical protein
MMSDQTWPSTAYIRRLFAIYSIAAGVAGVLTFIALILVYAPKPGFLFLAGIVTGVLAAYAARSGLIIRIWTWAVDTIRHPRAILPY